MFNKYHVKSNTMAIYLLKDSRNANYKEVIDSLQLKSLIRPTDDVANFKCCQRVKNI